MLRVTVEHQMSSDLLILEGRLSGAWVEEVRKVLADLWSETRRSGIQINLTSLSGMDPSGRGLLIDAYMRGAELVGSGLTARAFIEEVASTTGPGAVAGRTEGV